MKDYRGSEIYKITYSEKRFIMRNYFKMTIDELLRQYNKQFALPLTYEEMYLIVTEKIEAIMSELGKIDIKTFLEKNPEWEIVKMYDYFIQWRYTNPYNQVTYNACFNYNELPTKHWRGKEK